MIYGKSEPSIRICTYVREARHARPDHYDVATDERQKHADEILADSPREPWTKTLPSAVHSAPAHPPRRPAEQSIP